MTKTEQNKTKFIPAIQATIDSTPGICVSSIEACRKCDGSGELQPDVQCKRCEGTGIENHDNPTMKTLELKISPAYIGLQCTLEDWDLGVPIGYGKTVQDAIESFLESWTLHFDYRPSYNWK